MDFNLEYFGPIVIRVLEVSADRQSILGLGCFWQEIMA